MFDAMQKHLDSVANPGTIVNLQGTAVGGFADQYWAFLHLDGSRVLTSSLENAANGFTADVYAMANSLDPGVSGLREILDVPVLTLMEVACSLAPSFGDRYGFLVPNRRFHHTYRDLVAAYGLEAELGGIDHLGYDRILDMRKVFVATGVRSTHALVQSRPGLDDWGNWGVEVDVCRRADRSTSRRIRCHGIERRALPRRIWVAPKSVRRSGWSPGSDNVKVPPVRPTSRVLTGEALAEYDLSFFDRRASALRVHVASP